MTTIRVLFFPVFFMMFTLFCYYVLNPYPSEFSIISAGVSSFSITDSPPKLSANFNLTMSAMNPNRYRVVHYDNVAATLKYGPDTLALATLPAFHLRGWNSTTVPAMAKEVVTEYYTSMETIKGIVADLAIHQAVVFDVNVYARASFESPMEVEKHLKMKCKDVNFWFNNSDAASMFGPPVTCQVVEWD